MIRVLTYSVLLIVGMVLSQLPAIDHLKPEITALTMIFLAYIMIQVGMEFEIDKTQSAKIWSRLPCGNGCGGRAVAHGCGLLLVVLSYRNRRKPPNRPLCRAHLGRNTFHNARGGRSGCNVDV